MSQRSDIQSSTALHTFLQHTSAVIGLFVIAALGILYFRTRTVVHTFDAVSYMWNIEVKPLPELFHPHHLLYAPFGKLAYQLAQALGYKGHSDIPIQVVNAWAGALGILFLWRFGVHWTKRVWASLGTAAIVGVAYAYWLYASEVEVYTLAAAFLTLSMWILAILDKKPRPVTAAALGIAHAGAIMFHQTNILFAVPIMVFLLLRPTLRRFSILMSYIGVGALAVAIPYGLVIIISGLSSPEAIYRWLTDYAQTGRWGGYLSLEHLPALQAGLGNSISSQTWLVWMFYGLAGAGIGLGLWQSRRDPRRASWLAFGGTWLAVYGAFFWWWEPFNIEFWIALLPAWGFCIMAGWPPSKREAKASHQGLRLLQTAYTIVPIALAFLLFRANLAPVKAAGDPENDYYYLITMALQAKMAPDDLIVTRGNILDVYIPFYTRHSGYLSLREAEYNSGGDPAQMMDMLVSRLDEALATGNTIWIDQIVLDETRSAERNPFGLSAENIETLKKRYSWQPDVTWNGSNVFYSTPHVFPPEVTSWAFVDSLLGWRARGVTSPHFDQAWCFASGDDPQLQSPQLDIDAGQWLTLEIDMELEAEQSYLQVFWRTKKHDYALDFSTQIDIIRGRQTYLIPLAELPGWEGTITQLRIDPTPGREDTKGYPVTACLYSIRLIENSN